MILLGYLVLTVLVGVIAGSRGRTGVGWAILSLLISPLISVIVLLILPNLARSTSPTLGVNEAIRLHTIELQLGQHIRSHKPPFSGKLVHDVTINGGRRRFTDKTEALAYVAAVSGMQAQLPEPAAVEQLPPPRR